MEKPINEELLTVSEVAVRLRLKAATVRSLVREGRIPFLRLGRNITRFRWERVREVMEERAAGTDSNTRAEAEDDCGQSA